ncbi:MAG: dihydroorotase [Firmicutes bacterium]|nr:dihydroorotase [Bacillota bacterium]
MERLLKNGKVFMDGRLVKADLRIKEERITAIAPELYPSGDDVVLDMKDWSIFPGFVDVHVHLREPGFLYKESIASGTAAAARGGFTTVCAMPNLKPVPDCPENLRPQLEAIEKTAAIRVLPYAAITKGQQGQELAELEALAEQVIAFSDDGRGVQSPALMEEAMRRAKALGKLIVAHCEDNSLLRGGYIHDGEYARAHGHLGICSESEWGPIARDLELVAKTGCAYHVCHISTKESLELIRQAKASGLDVSCETAPHYLTLDDSQLQEDGRFKMNPPLRSPEDREALLAAIQDGTVDMIATDHAPHSREEKAKGLKDSAMGVVGLECAFPVLYSRLVQSGTLSLEQLIRLMQENPSRRFGLGNPLSVGQPADLCAFDLEQSYVLDPEEFLSQGRATPFAGWQVQGRCKLTMVGGRIVWGESR